MWWIAGGFVVLGLVFAISLAVIAGRADERLAQMRDNDDYTRGG